MGATDFTNFVPKREAKTVDQAFYKVRDAAAWECGHGGYTGTIAEKPGFEKRGNGPMTKAEARAFINSDLDNNDKWGDAFVVEVSEPEPGWIFYGLASS